MHTTKKNTPRLNTLFLFFFLIICSCWDYIHIYTLFLVTIQVIWNKKNEYCNTLCFFSGYIYWALQVKVVVVFFLSHSLYFSPTSHIHSSNEPAIFISYSTLTFFYLLDLLNDKFPLCSFFFFIHLCYTNYEKVVLLGYGMVTHHSFLSLSLCISLPP